MINNKFFKALSRAFSVILTSGILLSSSSFFSLYGIDSTKIWVGTWATAPQLVEPNNMPPSPGLDSNSLRQIVRVSIGGDTLRVRFSNEFSTSPVTMKSVQVAGVLTGSMIDITTNVELKFNDSIEVTMEPGEVVISDPIPFTLTPRKTLAITIYFGQTSTTVTGHPGSRTTSYIKAGNNPSVTDFSGAVTTDHWYVISGIDVLAQPTTSCVAIIGNSITDGRGSTTNSQNRWTDVFSQRLIASPNTQGVGVLNLGLGGNCVLKFCLGPAAIDRYERDILNQPGVRAAIILEGVNDIGGVKDVESVSSVANDLIAAYIQMIDSTHARNIMAYGGTIMPFKGNGYYNIYSEACRNKVNYWIRTSGRFDAVIDFDRYLRDPLDTAKLGVATLDNDGLHPTAAGHKMMADSVDLKLFEGLDTIAPVIDTTGIEMVWLEPECGTVGENWESIIDSQVSNQGYVMVKPGFDSISTEPTDTINSIYIPFAVTKDTTYYVFARLSCPSTDEDSYWVKMDDGEFASIDGLVSSGWEWKGIGDYELVEGEHTLTIACREGGANLDKLCITNSMNAPIGIGKSSNVVCLPDTTTEVVISSQDEFNGSNTFVLGKNYPNPFTGVTTIEFKIPIASYVSLKVYDILGTEIAELAGQKYTQGKHTVEFNAHKYPKGLYFYTLKANNYSVSQKMILQGK